MKYYAEQFYCANICSRWYKENCKCCVCTSGFSPEDVELIFLRNVYDNKEITQKKENHQKIQNLFRCINTNSLVFYEKRMEGIHKNFEIVSGKRFSMTDTKGKTLALGKRGTYSQFEFPAKCQKVDDFDGKKKIRFRRKANRFQREKRSENISQNISKTGSRDKSEMLRFDFSTSLFYLFIANVNCQLGR